jgi:trans-2,3-dihydro-3-hydroxyanthranilate isomerase
VRPVLWVDAFTETRFGGNPCAVVFDGDDVSVEDRLAFTRETRLSETAFLVASNKADFGARYYVASGEILMAGHPTIATVAALVDRGMVDLSAGTARFTLEVGAGVLPIEVVAREGRPPLIAMTQPAPVFGRRYDRGEIAALVGLDAEDVAADPRTVSTGTAFCITPLVSHEALARARLDIPALRRMRETVDFWEPFLCVTQGFTEAGDTAARLMLTPPEPPEDPFTGSATGCMAAYLWAEGLIDAPRFVAEQGHGMGRPGRAEVEALGPPDGLTGVRVAGSAVVLMRGTVDL